MASHLDVFFIKGEIMNLGDLIKSGAISIDQANAPASTLAAVQFPQTQQQQLSTQSAPNYAGSIMSALGSSEQLLGQREAEQMANLGLEYSTQRGGLEAARATGAENLATQGKTATRAKSMSLRDLAQNVRNAYQSGINRLAAGGGADSSAAGMYAYALGQQQQESQGKVMEDYTYNMGLISDKQKQLERDFNSKIAALDNWKFQTAARIRDAFLVERDKLNQMRAQYGGGYVDAAQAQLAQQAAAELANVSNQVTSASNLVANDFAKAQVELRDIQQANVNPNLAMQGSGVSTQNNILQTINPTLYKRTNEQAVM